MTQEGTVPTLTELQERGSKSDHPDDWAEWIIQQLQAVTEYGLPEAYHGDIQSFLADLWVGDMPWIESLGTQVEEAIEVYPDFQSLRTKFQERFNTDFWNANWEAEWEEEEGRYIDSPIRKVDPENWPSHLGVEVCGR